ncbi:MAG TPA: hypothetical protein VF914_08995 [Chloroflexia bacterium]
MASTVGMVSRAVQPDDVLNGLKATRFSLHFNMRRMWRWVLVQFVGVPARPGDRQSTASARPVPFRGPQATIARLVDDYMAAQFARRLA